MLCRRWLTPVWWPSAFSLVLWCGEAIAATRVVPTQFPTIQEAIWASSGTDTVLVLPGTYRENVVMDRYVVLRSAQGPQVTVIDGSDPRNPDSASTVRMMNGVIEGFDIRNGTGALEPFFSERHGGGILGSGTVVIRGNWIHDNTLSSPRGIGGGVYVEDGTGTVVGNRIYGNRILSQQLGGGGGLVVAGFSSVIEQNEVYDNHVMRGEAGGASTNGLLRRRSELCTQVRGPVGRPSAAAAAPPSGGSAAGFPLSQT